MRSVRRTPIEKRLAYTEEEKEMASAAGIVLPEWKLPVPAWILATERSRRSNESYDDRAQRWEQSLPSANPPAHRLESLSSGSAGDAPTHPMEANRTV